MDNNVLQTFINGKLPAKSSRTPSGWIKFNAVCCVHNGESVDTKGRGGILYDHAGSVTYNCFNCKFKTSWKPGRSLPIKMKSLMFWLGATTDEVKRISYQIWKIKQTFEQQNTTNENKIEKTKFIGFEEVPLPDNAHSFKYWLEKPIVPIDCKRAIEYVLQRGEYLLNYDFYWTPKDINEPNRPKKDMPKRIIMPIMFRGKNIGWVARRFDNGPSRYINNEKANPAMLFNPDAIYAIGRKYIIVVEGPFDSLALDCVGALGSTLNMEQVNWLESSGKEIIVLPDMHHTGRPLVEVAKLRNWYVSFPKWDKHIKDSSEAVLAYGRLATLQMVLDGMTKNHLKIDIEMERYMPMKKNEKKEEE